MDQKSLPSDLAEYSQKKLAQLAEIEGWSIDDELSDKEQVGLERLLACSDFVFERIKQKPANVSTSDYLKSFASAYRLPKSEALDSLQSTSELDRFLRRERNAAMLHIAWRDLLGLASLEEVLTSLSSFADWSIQMAIRWHHNQLLKEFSIPEKDHAEVPPLIVIAMGKLGGGELNFSSDVDLIFFYQGSAYDVLGETELTKDKFYLRLGQRVIQTLDKRTADGFVHRVDMRLRPYGESGVLAMSCDAAEVYYQEQGREWERYAFIKARCIHGQESFTQSLAPVLHSFVYRKYIDFGVLDSIREMKILIQKELRRKNLKQNIKLGAGGIREIEFICQSYQLIRGGQEPALQQVSLLRTLKNLEELEYLPSEDIKILRDNYFFLRKLEHTLQEINDKQTQNLPIQKLDMARVAYVMGFDTYREFEERLFEMRGKVHDVFRALIEKSDEAAEENDPEIESFKYLWLAKAEESEWLAQFEKYAFKDAKRAANQIFVFRTSNQMRHLGLRGKKRLDHVLPGMLKLVVHDVKPDKSLPRVLDILGAILKRTAYLVLLDEHPQAVKHLVRLCTASAWVTQHLVRYPILLDELLDHRLLLNPPDRKVLASDMTQLLLRIPEDDLESRLEGIRQFKQASVLKLAAASIAGVLNCFELSVHLSALAELVLKEIIFTAFHDLVGKYGLPSHMQSESDLESYFAVLAYGKLGSQEISLASDLDLVFVHQFDSEGRTKGEKSIANSEFVIKFAQRVINFLAIRTSFGRLYEVDLRLRPSGHSGLLVTQIDSFKNYQMQDAWTWEHQALTRARCVFGSRQFTTEIERIREQVLIDGVNRDSLKSEILSMRQKMREQLDKSKGERFDIKHGEGGLVDIEFLLQYLLLSHCTAHPDLLKHRSAMKLTQVLEKKQLISEQDTNVIKEAVERYQKLLYQAALEERSAVFSFRRVDGLRKKAAALWEKYFLQEA